VAAWAGPAAVSGAFCTGAAGVTGGAGATPFIAWKKAARAEAAVLEGPPAGKGEGMFGRMVVIGSSLRQTGLTKG
jgi:hypothetical protein